MKEYKVGEEITLVVKEAPNRMPCSDCFFIDENGFCIYDSYCSSNERSDGKNVIFVEKGK